MTRYLLAALVVLAAGAAANAQYTVPLTTASGVGGFGGTFRPATPGMVAPGAPMIDPRFSAGITVGHRIFPSDWVGYNPYAPFYGYGYTYVPPVAVVEVPVVPVVVTPQRPARPALAPVELSNEFPATLVMQFPSDAEVWVDGKKQKGDADTEWTLTSPVLKAGGEYTFDVKGRWKSGGKTYEAQRSVTVAGGERKRVLVVSGTEVR
jgi:uncharacterized protein (TIGR03000 family)